jgi:starch synthase
MGGKMKKVLFASSECVPFVKTGGLADVVGALPKEFDKKDWDIRVVLPDYTCIPPQYRDNFEYVCHFQMNMGPHIGDKYVGVMKYEYNGITFYFIDNLEYFECFYPYSDARYDIEKFIFFDKAVLSMLPLIDFQPDIIHCHDWQTGLIPVYLKTEFASNLFFTSMKSIITIHNLKFQGIWDIKTIQGISGLPMDVFTHGKLEFKKSANMLKGGIVYADYITTVSETYANEIQSAYYGEGLDGLLYARRLDMKGIVNGIDYDAYNPMTDKALFKNYGPEDFRTNKKINKTKLQEMLGLTVDKKKYMIGLISRLTDQKGLDLINYCIERLVDDNTQLVVIGTGESKYENMFRHYAWKYPDKISANICYSEDLARKLYAAADAFLMPSQFEPCGLTQLISFRYGTVPIVRETGGLKDTVIPFNEYEHTGDGFSFANYNGDELLNAVNYSKFVYFEKKTDWNKMIDRGMAKDYSWKNSRAYYEGLYSYLIG